MSKPVRTIRIEGDIAYVPLTKGYEAIIDTEDVEKVEKFNWYSNVNGRAVYGQRSINRLNCRRTVMLHMAVSGMIEGKEIDHVNGDGLDNRKANLRHVLHSENMKNAKKRVTSKHKYKGVCINHNRFSAKIRNDNKSIYLGTFDTQEEAHAAYCHASIEMHGKYGNHGT